MKIFIEPSDVLLFRDGRPFSAGEGHRAKSIFPPTPSTMQGVIRSKVLAERCGKFTQYRDGCVDCPEQNACTIPLEIGTANLNEYGNIEIIGALIGEYKDQKLKVYFPIPADVVQIKDKSEGEPEQPKLAYLQPLEAKIYGETDLDQDFSTLRPLWQQSSKPVESAHGYWEYSKLEQYLLEGDDRPTKFIKIEDKTEVLYQTEPRYGIEIDNARQKVQEGKLYQTEFIRCEKNKGLYLEINGISKLNEDANQEKSLIAIGGENKAAGCIELHAGIDKQNLKDSLKEKLVKSDGFKLYLATPTIFEQGWLPKWIDSKTLEGEYRGVNVKLIAATIPRYQTIGGWDVAHNKPKPTVRAVSAGSVYYFTTNTSPDKLLQAFHWQNLADNSSNAQIGYGLALVGAWNYCKLEGTK